MDALTLLLLAGGAYAVSQMSKSQTSASTVTGATPDTQLATPSQIQQLRDMGVAVSPTDKVETVTQVGPSGQTISQTFVNNTPIFTNPDDRYRAIGIYIPQLNEADMAARALRNGQTDWQTWIRSVVSDAYRSADTTADFYSGDRLRMTFKDWDYFRGSASPVPSSVYNSSEQLTDDQYKQKLYDAGAYLVGNEIHFPAGMTGLGYRSQVNVWA